MTVRPQYHFRDSPKGLLAWRVNRLIELADSLPVEHVDVSSIVELDEPHWYLRSSQIPTCRSILEHLALIEAADLAYPIILDTKGRVMDGMHRVCKALMRGNTRIAARRFRQDPEPDFCGLEPHELPY
ncbi:MAG: hypothetical protein AAF654_06685 [Myxococcota bacterium]